MEKSFYREKSRSQISSPEQLDDYFATTSPKVWLVLAAFFALLLGALIYMFVGSIETVIDTEGVVGGDGFVCCFIGEADYQLLRPSMTAVVENTNGKIVELDEDPMSYEEIRAHLGNNAYSLYAVGVKQGEWYYHIEIEPDTPLADGPANVSITVERKKLISMLLN